MNCPGFTNFYTITESCRGCSVSRDPHTVGAVYDKVHEQIFAGAAIVRWF